MAYEWIKSRLGNKHGAQAELARFIGIKQDKLNKVLAGTRQLTAREVSRVADYFKISEKEVLSGEGKNDGENVKAPDPQRESELALVYVLKMILQIMMQHRMVSTEGLDYSFSVASNAYEKKGRLKAVQMMELFREFASQEPRELEQAISRILVEKTLNLMPGPSAGA